MKTRKKSKRYKDIIALLNSPKSEDFYESEGHSVIAEDQNKRVKKRCTIEWDDSCTNCDQVKRRVCKWQPSFDLDKNFDELSPEDSRLYLYEVERDVKNYVNNLQFNIHQNTTNNIPASIIADKEAQRLRNKKKATP